MDQEATSKGLCQPIWLAILTATTVAMESQQSMMLVFAHATRSSSLSESIEVAEFMRNVGLKCLAMVVGVHVNEAPAITPS